MSGTWLVWAILATVAWGGGYACLKPVTGVSPFVIQILFGGGSTVLNLVAMGIWAATVAPNEDGDGASSAARFTDAWKQLGSSASNLALIGFVVANSFAGLAYLVASQMPDVRISVLTAFTAAYPVVTTVLVFAIFQEYANVDLRLAVPGILLSVGGCVLLALSPKPPS